MQIFQYPYILIPISVVLFFLLGGLGIYLILRSMKTEMDDGTVNEYTLRYFSKKKPSARLGRSSSALILDKSGKKE